MVDVTKVRFRYSPIVASELVKFLSLNDGFDTLKTLTALKERLKAEVAELKKMVNGTTKTLLINANKLNEQKSLIEGLTRRLAKLKKLQGNEVEVDNHWSQAYITSRTDVDIIQELFLPRTPDNTNINGVQTVTRLHRTVDMGYISHLEPMEFLSIRKTSLSSYYD